MITIGFGKKSTKVFELTKELFIKEKISFSLKNDPEKAGYALLFSEPEKKYDILLNHDSTAKTCGNFITLFNSDTKVPHIFKNSGMIVSYGINSLATIAASSISAYENCTAFQLCIQRSIASIKGKLTVPQEFPVCIEKSGINLSDALAFCSLALVLGISKEKLKCFSF